MGYEIRGKGKKNAKNRQNIGGGAIFVMATSKKVLDTLKSGLRGADKSIGSGKYFPRKYIR